MRTGIGIAVTASDKIRLGAIGAARGSPQKHVWRARIILLTDHGLGTLDHGDNGEVEDLRVALAGALHG